MSFIFFLCKIFIILSFEHSLNDRKTGMRAKENNENLIKDFQLVLKLSTSQHKAFKGHPKLFV